MPRNRLLKKKAFDVHQDATQVVEPENPVLDDSVPRTLTPASFGSINSMKSQTSSATSKTTLGRTPTIRSVPSQQETSPTSRNSVLSTNGQSSTASSTTMAEPRRDGSPNVRIKTDGVAETPSKWNSHTGAVRVIDPSPAQDSSMLSDGPEQGDGQWDSTIGKAGLGKTGRVINKLVSDNDALKRDIQIERLRAEESKQAAKLVEDKMDRMVSDYESRLLEANVTKTLLARKERQVESLQAAIELEKNKAQAAIERERSWKRELENTQKETGAQVDEATTYAQLMEGRYNAISNHWSDQAAVVDKAVAEIRGEILHLVEERRADDTKIQTLRDLCDQQDSNIKELQREKEAIALKFAEYKKTQDDDLRNIRTNADKTEAEQQRLLDEAREALHKLRWALNVKNNVKGAH